MKKRSVLIILFSLILLILIISTSLAFIHLNKNSLSVTLEHPFFINGKLIKASELKVGDELTTVDGKVARITKITDVKLDEPVLVYNININYPNNYFADGILVHNKDLFRRVDVSEINPSQISYESISTSRKAELDSLAKNDRVLGPIDLESLSDNERLYLYEQRLRQRGLLNGELTEQQKKAFLVAHLSEVEGVERLQTKYNIAAQNGLSKEQIKVGMDDYLMGITKSRVKENPTLLKIAKDLPDDRKKEINDLMTNFHKGISNPGIGNNYFKVGSKQIIELRSRNGARVYLTPITQYNPADITKTKFEILAYSDKDTQDRVIALLRRLYE